MLRVPADLPDVDFNCCFDSFVDRVCLGKMVSSSLWLQNESSDMNPSRDLRFSFAAASSNSLEEEGKDDRGYTQLLRHVTDGVPLDPVEEDRDGRRGLLRRQVRVPVLHNEVVCEKLTKPFFMFVTVEARRECESRA